MQRSALIAGFATFLTVAAIAWFWSPAPRSNQDKHTLKKVTAQGGTKPTQPTVVVRLRSSQGLKLDSARNVLPDPPAAAERQKSAWDGVVRVVQAMNAADHERFGAALRGWSEVSANKALLEQIKTSNEAWPRLTPAEQEQQIDQVTQLYQTGLASLRQHYTELPAGLPVTPTAK